ncbi:MAG TPA: ROK family transcriptional regulator [Pyrinomonadaceae bacterium]|jgi:predicted NBD/HSP70 family sugar kinase
MTRRINLKKTNVARSNTIRDINRQIILNYVREEGPVSRAYITRVTELNRVTVSLIVDELLEADLVEEIEGESSGGRPPQLLSLKTTKAVAIGVDLGKKMTVVGTSNLRGRILEKNEFPTSTNFNKTLSRIIEQVQYYVNKSGGSIEGIGVSLPGLVESWKGKVVNIPHLDWHYPEIGEVIEKATGLPVVVENDTNATALAELWLGRPEISNVRDFVVVLIHSGIGTGIVFDGQIYRGKGGVAGEFGHMTIGTNAPVACAAGRFDCWEAFASERAALARYAKLAGNKNGKNQMLFEELIKLAFLHDENALKALKETAYYIGLGISNLTQGLSPEVTIIAGKFVQLWSLFADDIRKGAESGICQGYPTVKIMPSTLGAYPTLMGAFSLILASKFTSLHIK